MRNPKTGGHASLKKSRARIRFSWAMLWRPTDKKAHYLMNNDSQQNSNSGLQNKDGALFLRHWPMLLLVALVFIFLGDVWFGGRILILRDTFFGDTTYRIFIGRLMRAGSFPLWSSLSQCGIPFAASPFMCVLYPPNWFFLFPSFEWALRLWWTFHLV